MDPPLPPPSQVEPLELLERPGFPEPPEEEGPGFPCPDQSPLGELPEPSEGPPDGPPEELPPPSPSGPPDEFPDPFDEPFGDPFGERLCESPDPHPDITRAPVTPSATSVDNGVHR